MAQTKLKSEQALGGNGWILADETWTYASASTITVPTGAASKYAKGDRIMWTQTTVKYGVVVAVADTLLTIAVNTDYTVANAAITLNYYSHQMNPVGYPHWFTFTPTLGGTGSMTISSPATEFAKFKVDGSTCFVLIRATGTTGGTASTGFTFATPVGTINDASPASGAFITDSSSMAGFCLAATTTTYEVRRYDNANWGLGASKRIATQVFYGF